MPEEVHCCICVPFSIAMISVGVCAVIELFYELYLAEVMLSNDGNPAAVFWIILKILPVAGFIYLAINKDDVAARRRSFYLYSIVQLLEVAYILTWMVISWKGAKYGCMFNADCVTPLRNCYDCFILVWVLGLIVVTLPLKVLCMFTCYGYYLEAAQDYERRTGIELAHPLCPTSRSPTKYEGGVNKTGVTTSFTDRPDESNYY